MYLATLFCSKIRLLFSERTLLCLSNLNNDKMFSILHKVVIIIFFASLYIKRNNYLKSMISALGNSLALNLNIASLWLVALKLLIFILVHEPP
jgi:hypothetical protein